MTLADRAAFAERIRVQLLARYRGLAVEIDPQRFALHVTGASVDATLPLAPVHNSALREPARAPAIIAGYVATVESQLTPRGYSPFNLGRVVWCVRTSAYLKAIGRAPDLLTRDVAGELVAFVAEALPGAVMRGVPRQDWAAGGFSDDAVAAAADAQTARRFTRLIDRIHAAERVPADGWRMAGDQLFQGSVLLVPDVLAGLAARAGGDVLIGVPDRGVVLALPTAMPAAAVFGRRVLREWRDAMNPCSRQLLESDGRRLRAAAQRGSRAGAWVMPWLQE